MAQLQLGVPLTTAEPAVTGPADLKPGRYRVELVVDGPSGRSAPATLTLVVSDTTTPIRGLSPGAPDRVATPAAPTVPAKRVRKPRRRPPPGPG